MRVAGELSVSPWEALTSAVRMSAHRVAWTEQELARVVDEHGADSAQAHRWLSESRRERALLAKSAKTAVDAGVAAQLVRNHELEGRLVADAVGRALDALDLPEESRRLVFAEAQRALLEASGVTGDGGTVLGQVGLAVAERSPEPAPTVDSE